MGLYRNHILYCMHDVGYFADPLPGNNYADISIVDYSSKTDDDATMAMANWLVTQNPTVTKWESTTICLKGEDGRDYPYTKIIVEYEIPEPTKKDEKELSK